jgi:fructokinase
MIRIGVDFGGTKIEAAALDAEGHVVARVRSPNPRVYAAALREVRSLVEEVERRAGRSDRVGVAMPGSISPRAGVIRNANSTWLNGRRFGEDLQSVLGRPVRLANDANCLALSESVDGAAAGRRVVFAVIIGTGFGGGLAVDGRIIEGHNGITAECGHIPLPWPLADEVPGPACWCGQHGCMETYVSGPGLARDFEAATGKQHTAEEIVEAARSGHAQSSAALARYVDRLGRGLAVIVNLIDPDVIVLGGGMSNVDELYEQLPAVIAPRLFSDQFETPVVKALHGDSSGVRGAAWLWPLEALA